MDEILIDGWRIMGVGMAAVFCFLLLMVLTMNLSAWIFSRWGHLFSEEPAGGAEVEEEIAVVLAAIQAHAQ